MTRASRACASWLRDGPPRTSGRCFYLGEHHVVDVLGGVAYGRAAYRRRSVGPLSLRLTRALVSFLCLAKVAPALGEAGARPPGPPPPRTPPPRLCRAG